MRRAESTQHGVAGRPAPALVDPGDAVGVDEQDRQPAILRAAA